MSHWNYRVVRKPWPDTDSVSYELHEVYYTDEGAIESWTADPVAPRGESSAELREDVRWFLQAFRRPILEARSVEGCEVLVEDEYDHPINEGHYFELMDRASVALDYRMTGPWCWTSWARSTAPCRRSGTAPAASPAPTS